MVALLAWRWARLLTATLSRELAAASGINADREGLVLTLALAVVVAVAFKVVGALLIAAMLIIPAAAARGLARSPEAMALGAVCDRGGFGPRRARGVVAVRHAGGPEHRDRGSRALRRRDGAGSFHAPLSPSQGP